MLFLNMCYVTICYLYILQDLACSVLFCDNFRCTPGSQAEPLESRNVVAFPLGVEEAHGAPASALHQVCHRVPAYIQDVSRCFKDIGHPNGLKLFRRVSGNVGRSECIEMYVSSVRECLLIITAFRHIVQSNILRDTSA